MIYYYCYYFGKQVQLKMEDQNFSRPVKEKTEMLSRMINPRQKPKLNQVKIKKKKQENIMIIKDKRKMKMESNKRKNLTLDLMNHLNLFLSLETSSFD